MPSPCAPVVNLRSFGAVGDGDHDDTAAIQAAVDGVGPGGTLIIPPGTWRYTHAIYVTNPYVTIIGAPGAELLADDDASVAFNVQADRVSLESLNLIWTGNPGGTLTLDSRMIEVGAVSNTRISSTVITGGPSAGIQLNGSTDFVVENNTVDDVRGVGITALGGAKRGVIRGNLVDGALVEGIAVAAGVADLQLTSDIVIDRNTITGGTANQGIDVLGGDRIDVTNNLIVGATGLNGGIWVGSLSSTFGVRDSTVTGNTIIDAAPSPSTRGLISVNGRSVAGTPPAGKTYLVENLLVADNVLQGVTSINAGVKALTPQSNGLFVLNNTITGVVGGAPLDSGTTANVNYLFQGNTYNGVLVGTTGIAVQPTPPPSTNLPPVITPSVSSVTMNAGDVYVVAATAVDPEGGLATIEVTSRPTWSTVRMVSPSQAEVQLSPTSVASAVVTFRAVDPAGNVGTAAIPVTVQAGTGAPSTGPGFVPTNLLLAPAVTSISFTVNPPTGSDRMRVDWFNATTGIVGGSVYVTSVQPTTSYTITGLTAGTAYRVRVYAAAGGQAPGVNDWVESTTTTQASGSGGSGGGGTLPTNVVATPASTSIAVSAVPPAGADRLLFSWSGPVGFLGSQYVTAATPTTSYTITGLTASTVYTVTVAAGFNGLPPTSGSLVQVVVTTQAAAGGGTVAATGEFQIAQGTDGIARVYDPDGRLFVPVGVTSDGPNSFFVYPTQGKAASLQAEWNVNFIRLVCVYPRGADFGSYFNQQPRDLTQSVAMIRAIVDEYQARKMVVMIDLHVGDFGGDPPSNASEAQSWWQTIATAFKNDPWVWFELWNEPGGTNAQWSTFHNAVISTVRGTGARNLIVLDDRWAGQGAGDWWSISPSPSADSALISATVTDPLNRWVGACHPYDVWGFPNNQDFSCATRYTDAQRDARLRSYVTRIVHDRGVPLIFDEFGWRPTDSETTGVSYHGDLSPGTHPPCGSTNMLAGHCAFRVAPEFDVGCCMWSEGFPLVDGSDPYDRTGVNLTTMGALFDGFGVQAVARMAAAAAQAGSGALAVPSNIVTTPASTTILVTATPPAGADRLWVQWSLGSTVLGENYVPAVSPTTSYLIPSLTASTTYTVKVGAAKVGQTVDVASEATRSVITTSAGSAPSNAFTFNTDTAGIVRLRKDGSTFIPVGVNMPADHGYWGGGFVGEGQGARVKSTWGWNIIRLFQQDVGGGECESCPDADNGFTILDAVTEYTALGYVVMIDYHQFGFGRVYGSDQITKIVNFWTPLAAQFKTNPLVWFEITNEPEATFNSYVIDPTQNPDQARASMAQRWYDAHVAAVNAIRGQGAPNMIVCCDGQAGQGCDEFLDITVPPSGSAIVLRGNDLVTHDNGLANGGKLMWDVHVYDVWGPPNNGATDCSGRFTDTQRDAKFRSYVNQVHTATGRPLLMGEFGYQPGDSETTGVGFHTYTPECGSQNMLAMKVGMRVGREFDMGGTEWPGFQLTPNGVDAYDYQNRYPCGEDWWQYTQWALGRMAANAGTWPIPTTFASSSVTTNSAHLSWAVPSTTRNITGTVLVWSWGGLQRGTVTLSGAAIQYNMAGLPSATPITVTVGFIVDGQTPATANLATRTFSTS